jgi:hypothetical protein
MTIKIPRKHRSFDNEQPKQKDKRNENIKKARQLKQQMQGAFA